jgi:hypothetical protein
MNDILISRLAPVTDEQAATMVSRQALGELAENIMATAPQSLPAAQGRRHARPDGGTRRSVPVPWAVGVGAVGLAAAAVVAVIVTAGQPAPGGKIAQHTTPVVSSRPAPAHATPSSHSDALDAWTVTKNTDGTVKVTVREERDAAGLQATLRADGVRVVVTNALTYPAACSEWRSGNYVQGDSVVQSANRTGLPAADGTDVLIKPAAIPAGALLWFNIDTTDISRFGPTKNLPGPPWVLGFGYLTDSEACANS